jgi:NADH:ubiquinone oxidoreductase subunit 6 (subunit J)
MLNKCLEERLVDTELGVCFLILAGLFLAMGVTFLPVVGIIAAMGFIWLSLRFFMAPPGEACTRSSS